MLLNHLGDDCWVIEWRASIAVDNSEAPTNVSIEDLLNRPSSPSSFRVVTRFAAPPPLLQDISIPVFDECLEVSVEKLM